MKKEWKAWALKGKYFMGDEWFYLGRYWCFDKQSPVIPPQFTGYYNVLFETRKLAKEYEKKSGFALCKGECKVFRVRITIEDADSTRK